MTTTRDRAIEVVECLRDACSTDEERVEYLTALFDELDGSLPIPIPLRLPCPACGALHIDEGEFATKPHHTHACQVCGLVWRPALVSTVGVQFLPGFKNPEAT